MSQPLDLSSRVISDIVVHTKYARYQEDLQRRRTWQECVKENEDMHIRRYPHLEAEIRENFKYVYNKEVLTSMRSMQYGGLPIELSPNRVYNCAFAHVDDKSIFSEFMFLLMGGSGVGYSVQGKHVAKLPPVQAPDGYQRFLISDSVEGWADAVRTLSRAYFQGKFRPIFDDRDIRPKGARIKKAGGKAPGSRKLMEALANVEKVFVQAVGRGLTELESHDIACYVADCIVSGGVRDSAMISLFSPDNMDMITCKGSYKAHIHQEVAELEDGKMRCIVKIPQYENVMNCNLYNGKDNITLDLPKWAYDGLKENGVLPFFIVHPQRARANNSMLIERGTVTKEEFFKLWKRVEDSGAGEPGIYWTNNSEQGTNPCAEIGLNSNQFCNLTTINGARVEGQDDYNKKARVAAFIGTLQAGYSDFHYLRPIWRETTEKEALLGVSITNIAYNKLEKLEKDTAAKHAVAENVRVAKLIGINAAARVTCIKPEGSSTLALGTYGSGIHGIHDPFFIRNVRIKKADAIYEYLLSKIPDLVEDDEQAPDLKAVVSIPVKAPEGVIMRHETPIDLLERVKDYSINWVQAGHVSGENTHNVSATISIKQDEWEEVGEWMWENKDIYNGLACLPYDGGIYRQAPLQTITEEEYEEKVKLLEEIDLSQVIEEDDNTDLVNELACFSGTCEIA